MRSPLKSNQAINRLSWLRLFGLSLALIVLSILFFPPFYEDYEALFNSFLSGAYTYDMPFRSWYFMGHMGISNLYSFLYSWIGGVEWMSVFLYSYIWVSCALIFKVLYNTIRKKLGQKWQFYLILILVYIILFLPNVLILNYTRVGYLLSGSLMVWFIISFSSFEDIRKKTGLYFAILIGLFFSSLLRLEPTIASVAVIGSISLLFTKNFFESVKVLIAPITIVTIIFIGILINIETSDQFYKQVEPDLELQIALRGNIIGIEQMTNNKDSLKYQAATQMMWGDPEELDVEFLHAIVKKETGLFNKFQFDRSMYTLIPLLKRLGYIIFLFLSLIMFIFFRMTSSRKYYIILIIAWFSFFVFFQVYFAKIGDRTLLPLLGMTSIPLLILGVRQSRKSLYIIVLLLITSVGQLAYTASVYKTHHAAYKLNKDVRSGLNELAKDDILLLNATSFGNYTLADRPFELFDNSPFHRTYVNEAQVISNIRDYKAFLEKECSCNVNRFVSFYQYLLSEGQEKRVYLLSSEKRFELTRKYLKGIYNFDLNYRVVDSYPEVYKMGLQNKHNLLVYELL